MLNLSCRCGAVRIHLKKELEYVSGCRCEACHELGIAWATFAPRAVSIQGPTKVHVGEADGDDPLMETRVCANCGTTTHWVYTASGRAWSGSNSVGVNMLLAEESAECPEEGCSLA